MAAAGVAMRRKQRTAGATPMRVARRRSGEQRSVLESLLAGDADEDGGGVATPAKARPRGKQPMSEARRSAKKRRKKLRRARKKQQLRELRERGPEAEPEPQEDDGDEVKRLGGGNQAEDDAGVGGSSDNQSDGNDENAQPNILAQGSPVIRKKLFPGSDSSTSSESEAPEESADEQAVYPEEELENYERFVTKYAAESTSVLEAMTPRDRKKKMRQLVEDDLPTPEEPANTSELSESRLSDWQFKDTDDEDEEPLEVDLDEDDDSNDPTYNPHRSIDHVTVRKKKSRIKTEWSEKLESQGNQEFQTSESAQKSAQRRKRTRSTVLTSWSVEWPLTLAPSGKDVQLVVIGRAQGHTARYEIAKRITSTHFTSTASESIILGGSFDAYLSAGAEIPGGFVELMVEGIPPRYKRLLAPFAPAFTASSSAPKPRERAKKPPLSTPAKINSHTESKEPMTPVMKWWRTDSAATPTSKPPLSGQKTKKATTKTHSSASEKQTPVKRSKMKRGGDQTPDDWTKEQIDALEAAKLQIPTTVVNFWAEVAHFVPGKTANECRARSFAQFSTPPERKGKVTKKRPLESGESRVPAKVARAGTNKFKKQVREFVQEYEKKNVDDIFAAEATPLKAPSLSVDFDTLTSPTIVTPQKNDTDDGDESEDAPTPGLLTKLTASKRDDVDSYVLGIKRRHAGVAIGGAKAVRTSGLGTPSIVAAKKKPKAVHMVTGIGSHTIEGVVSPGGTTRVRIGKDGSSSEDDDDLMDDEDEERSDLSDV